MSVLGLLGFTLVLGAACFGSWKGALYWNRRTRDARNEDPRDQEIRELGAALSIARKELASVAEDKNAHSSEAAELASKLEHTGSSLADIQQKFNATKDHLNREIEIKQDIDQELSLVRRELEQARARVTELEIQSKVDHSGSGMIAGMDMLGDDDAEVDELKNQLEGLTAELSRWKQHCAVLTKTNKELRARETAESADTTPAQ
jgi:DNA repair exonuclease SbcCD ATPase subunit